MKRSAPMKRTEFKRKSPMKSGSATRRSKPALPQYSKKRASARTARQQVVLAALERAGHQCEARVVYAQLMTTGRSWLITELKRTWPIECAGPLDPDEIIARSAWAAGYLELGNVQVLCRVHHDWKHDHPALAKMLLMTRESWQRPEAGQPCELRVW